MAIHPLESQRVIAIINEAVTKLELLDALTPELFAQQDELNELVNDEISRIIEEQRRLQMTYESLIMQRSQLKNVTNKIKYKELQAEIEETATALRYATKVLCRNLKENPDVAENLSKIQQERQHTHDLLVSIIEEMRKENAYKRLAENLDRDRKKSEEIRTGTNRVKQTLQEIQNVQDEINELIEERKRDDTVGNEGIQRLHEELQEARAHTILESKYNKKEARARSDATRRVSSQTEKQNDQSISQLQKRTEVESKVHDENSNFLDRKYSELQQQTEIWDSKWETDIEEKERQVQELKSLKANHLMKLMELKKKHKEVQEILMKEKRLAEARAFAKEMQIKRQEAAIRIQNCWRMARKRKLAKDKLRRLKKAARSKKRGKKPSTTSRPRSKA